MQVSEVPKGLVRAGFVMAANAMVMAVAEIIIELLVLGGTCPQPFPKHWSTDLAAQ